MRDDWRFENETVLDALHWRDEILQIMFWLIGEGLVARPSAEDVRQFLGADLSTIQFYLEEAVRDGYLIRHPDSAGMLSGHQYALSEMGRREGGRRFADEFAEMTKPAHGECSADCDCHKTGKANCSHHH